MKKKNSKKMPVPTAPIIDTDVDSRPETSVFMAPIKTFRTNDGSQFNIPSPLLKECPSLAGKYSNNNWGTEPKLDIPLEVGHILVNYLFTKKYEHIKPKGTSAEERLNAEFATNIRVYAFARQMDFAALQNLAICEIQRIGKLLPFVTIIDQAKNAYPQIPSDDLWFIEYLKSGIQSLSDGQSTLPKQAILGVNDVLLQGFIDSCTSGTSSRKEFSNAAAACPSRDGFTLVMPQATKSAQKAKAEGSPMESQLRPEPEAEPPVQMKRHDSDEESYEGLVKGETSRLKSDLFLDEAEIKPTLEDEKPVVDETTQIDDDVWSGFKRAGIGS
ncbi:hypothetical protein NHJ6243_010037 [Beauveria neobassiana]